MMKVLISWMSLVIKLTGKLQLIITLILMTKQNLT